MLKTNIVGCVGLMAAAFGSSGCSSTKGASQAAEDVGARRQAVTLTSRTWQASVGGGFESTVGPTSVLVKDGQVRFATYGSSPSGTGSVAFTLVSAERNGGPTLTAPVTTLEGGKVVIDHGFIREELALTATGISSALVVPAEPSGTGPITVELKVDGELVDELDLQTTVPHFKLAGLELDVRNVTYHRDHVVVSLELDGTYPHVSTGATIVPTFRLTEPQQIPNVTALTAMACRTDQCFSMWRDGGGGLVLSGLRTKPDGAVVSTVQSQVAFIGGGRLSANPAGEYLAVIEGDYKGLRGTFIDADTGRASDYPGFPLGTGHLEAATFSGGVHLFSYRDGDTRYVARVAPESSGVLGAPTNLGAADKDAAMAAGNGQVAIVSGNKLQRVDASNGNLLDATPITFSQYGYGSFAGKSSVIFDGTNYIVVWVNAGQLLAARVRASDGQVLDADDTQAQTIGARRLCDLGLHELTLGLDGSRLLVTWWEDKKLRATAFTLDPWTSSSAACQSALVEESPSAAGSVAFSGSHATAWFPGGGYPEAPMRRVSFDITGPSTISISANGTPTYANAPSYVRAAASNGRDFLVASGVSYAAANSLTLIDGATGAKRWTRSITKSAAVAASATGYLLGTDHSQTPVTCDGHLGQEHERGGDQSLDALLSDGQRYYGLFSSSYPYLVRNAVRFDENGIEQGDVISLSQPSGEQVTTDSASRALWLLGGSDAGGLRLRKLNGSDGAISEELLLSSATYKDWSIGGDGKNLLLMGPSANGRVGIVRTTTGVELVPSKVLPLPQDFGKPGWDGVSYVFTTPSDSNHYDNAKAYRLNSALNAVDANAQKLIFLSNLASSNQHGRSLIRFQGGSDFQQAYGYFFDNDQAPVDPNTVAQLPCVPTSEGGSGGTGGGGGSGGLAAGGSAGGGGSSVTATGGTSGNAGADTGGGNAGTSGGGSAGTSGGGSAGTSGGGSAGTSGGGSAGTSGGGSAGTSGGGSAGTSGGGSAGTSGSDSAGTSGGGSAGTSGGGSAGTSTDYAGAGNDEDPELGGAGGEPSGNGATAGNGNSKPDDGCSCRAAGAPTPQSPWALALGALMLLRRRRSSQNGAAKLR